MAEREDGKVRLPGELVAAALRKRASLALALWATARRLDGPGRGLVPVDRLASLRLPFLAGREGVHPAGGLPRPFRRALAKAQRLGLVKVIRIREDPSRPYLKLASLGQAVEILASQDPSRFWELELGSERSLAEVEAKLFLVVLAGCKGHPVSLACLSKLTGRSGRTLQRWIRYLGPDLVEIESNFERREGPAVFPEAASMGFLRLRSGEVVRRLPSTYRVLGGCFRGPRGRCRHAGGMPRDDWRGADPTVGDTTRSSRLYYPLRARRGQLVPADSYSIARNRRGNRAFFVEQRWTTPMERRVLGESVAIWIQRQPEELRVGWL